MVAVHATPSREQQGPGPASCSPGAISPSGRFRRCAPRRTPSPFSTTERRRPPGVRQTGRGAAANDRGDRSRVGASPRSTERRLCPCLASRGPPEPAARATDPSGRDGLFRLRGRCGRDGPCMGGVARPPAVHCRTLACGGGTRRPAAHVFEAAAPTAAVTMTPAMRLASRPGQPGIGEPRHGR